MWMPPCRRQTPLLTKDHSKVKSGLISESFSVLALAQISKKTWEFIILSIIIHVKNLLRIVIWHLFGDLSQSENLSEIKPPLAEVVWTEDAKTLKFLRGTVSFEKSSKSGVRCNVTHGKIFQQSTYPLYFWHGTYYILPITCYTMSFYTRAVKLHIVLYVVFFQVDWNQKTQSLLCSRNLL